MKRLLTEAEIDSVLFPFDRDSSFNDISRAIEAKILEKIGEPQAWMNPMNMVVMDHKRKINNEDRYSNFSNPLYAIPFIEGEE